MRSGYRLGESPARRYDAHPGSSGTNVIMRTRGGVDERELIAAVGDGIYIGRIWYTYPINGQRAGDFTCTVSGDSYVIRNGRIAAPLAPNCFRINANIEQVFTHPLAIGKRSEIAVVWGSPEAYFVPALALDRNSSGASRRGRFRLSPAHDFAPTRRPAVQFRKRPRPCFAAFLNYFDRGIMTIRRSSR